MSFTSRTPCLYFNPSDISLSDFEANFIALFDSNLFNIFGGKRQAEHLYQVVFVPSCLCVERGSCALASRSHQENQTE
jgi:hypothetical protein